MTTAAETPERTTGTRKTARGLNGISLGVHRVFDAAERDGYLEKRFASWNISGPSGYEAHVHELPPVHHEASALRLHGNARVSEKAVAGFRECAAGVMDHYFPPIGDESVVEDILTFTTKPYFSHPAGTAVVIRRTSKAILFYLDPSVRVEAEGASVTDIQTIEMPARPLLLAGTAVADAQMATKILGAFTSLLPGPYGAAAKIGIDLISQILGLAGSSGPSWDEITAMMRQVVREELITNDLEFVQADYESVMKWSDIQYLPNRQSKPKKDLWDMLRPQIDLVSRDINLLLRTNHRIPGFGLLLLGVDVYLGLLQEQIALGYDADIRKAGDQWATSMLEVWGEVQTDRHAQIVETQYSYGVPEPSHTVITCHYWSWTDKKTGESKGSRSGPWQCGGKNDHSQADCKADAEARYDNGVLPLMIKTFGDPAATASAWRAVKVPEKR